MRNTYLVRKSRFDGFKQVTYPIDYEWLDDDDDDEEEEEEDDFELDIDDLQKKKRTLLKQTKSDFNKTVNSIEELLDNRKDSETKFTALVQEFVEKVEKFENEATDVLTDDEISNTIKKFKNRIDTKSKKIFSPLPPLPPTPPTRSLPPLPPSDGKKKRKSKKRKSHRRKRY